MRSHRIIQGIDSHAAGCPLRIVTSGCGPLRGRTMVEKRASLMARDEFRRLVMFEPRGSFNMPSVVLTEPCSPEADIGMVIMEPDSYPPMCGHCAIAVATVAVEAGFVPVREGETTIRLDTPAGVVPARVEVAGSRAIAVTLEMPDSFLYRSDVVLDLEDPREVRGAIAWGGDFYFITEAAALGLELVPEQAWELACAGARIRKALQQQVEVRHPSLAHVDSIYQIELTGPARTDAGDGRNVVICPPSVIDRSPCGTGTAARVAALHAEGRIAPGDAFRHEGILNTVFTGRIAGTTRVGDFDAVRVTVTGSAWISGTFTHFLDPHDPFPAGYRLAGV